MSKKSYLVNCYTCEHNGQETCKGCNTLLVGEDEPYIEICIVQGILDAILKKYRGEMVYEVKYNKENKRDE